jgi:peptide/nickel transport system ATP-binding protein
VLIACYGLSKHFPVRGTLVSRSSVKAVEGATLKIRPGQIVGLVGESGSGKTTLGRCLIRLAEPTNGDILFDIPDNRLEEFERVWGELQSRELLLQENGGRPIRGDPRITELRGKLDAIGHDYSLVSMGRGRLNGLRRNMNIVFQDPYSSLDPRMKLSDIISEPMISTRFATRAEAREKSLDLLREVGLPDFFEDRFPHELSGGQRQRVAVARAISTNPKLLVLDEPTSALDVSVQAQILNLLRRLRDKYGIGMLLITHNIAVIAYLAETVYVMYAGKIMEWGDKAKVLREPEHPYTKALMSAVPIAGETKSRIVLRGDPPDLIIPPRACRFHPRCPVAFEICGWSGDEVSEDLAYMLTGKYFGIFGDSLTFETLDPNSIAITGEADPDQIRDVIKREAEEIRSLQAIDSITGDKGRILVKLHEPVDPEMYLIPDGREVNCLLFRPGAARVDPGAGAES